MLKYRCERVKIVVLTAILAGTAALIGAVSVYSNSVISVKKFEIKSNKIPKSFDGFKILQVSDLHNKRFGKNQEYLLRHINRLNPDIVVVTGDIVYRNYTKEGNVLRVNKVLPFVSGASEKYPLYYVTGNHEAECGYGEYVWKSIEEKGAKIIHGKAELLEKNGESIALLGAKDPFSYGSRRAYKELEKELFPLCESHKDKFRILLSHRPEIIDIYDRCGAELVLTGHAHGGQFRIPFTGKGIFAPDQGVLPRYTQGLHIRQNTRMIISRGLGNSGFPQRLFNRPELVLVTLKS